MSRAPVVTPRRGQVRLGTVVVVPWAPRSVLVGTLLALACLLTAAATLAWGSMGVGLADLGVLLSGEADPTTRFVLERLRGPRALVAVGVGAALGLSGALFQTVTRNPLGSPDVIGLGAGAGAGVAIATLLWPGAVPTPVAAVAGATVAIAVVHVSTGTGFTSPTRLILTGIGVAAMAAAVTQYVVAVALRDNASQLAGYLVGSLGSRDLTHVLVIAGALGALAPLLVALHHRLLALDLGDELASALGADPLRTRTYAVVLAVLLAAAAVSVAGPIAFVALTAPHVARRLTRSPGPNLVVSAVVGALVMLLADLAAQQVPWLDGVPVGVVTAGVGGLYLGYLLVLEWRRTRS